MSMSGCVAHCIGSSWTRAIRRSPLRAAILSRTRILSQDIIPFLTPYRRDAGGFRREMLSGTDAILSLPEAGVTIPPADLHQDVA
jgi:hypothetical protein